MFTETYQRWLKVPLAFGGHVLFPTDRLISADEMPKDAEVNKCNIMLSWHGGDPVSYKLAISLDQLMELVCAKSE